MRNVNYVIYIFSLLLLSCSEIAKDRVNLGNGYRFDYDPVISGCYAIFGPYENTYAVEVDVLSFAYDFIYIVAAQKPIDQILNVINKNPNSTYSEKKKISQESTLRYYWIIN